MWCTRKERGAPGAVRGEYLRNMVEAGELGELNDVCVQWVEIYDSPTPLGEEHPWLILPLCGCVLAVQNGDTELFRKSLRVSTNKLLIDSSLGSVTLGERLASNRSREIRRNGGENAHGDRLDT